MIDTLRGRTTVRHLRVMVENLAPDPALELAIGSGTPWGDALWVQHDISTHLRTLVAMFHNAWAPKGTAPLHLEPLPYPRPDGDDDVPDEQQQAEAELSALMHREG